MAKRDDRRTFRVSRDLALFIAGIVGVFHETLISSTERPSLLIVFAAMMGLPLYLRKNGQ